MASNFIAQRHELIAFHIYDAYEKDFFPQGLFRLRDLETQEQAIIDTADPNVQQHFQQNAQKHALAIKHLFARIGADYISMHTGESSTHVLHRFFHLRGKKR